MKHGETRTDSRNFFEELNHLTEDMIKGKEGKGSYKHLSAVLKELTEQKKEPLDIAFSAFLLGCDTGIQVERRRQAERRSGEATA